MKWTQILTLIMLACQTLKAEVHLPKLLSDGMVMQRNTHLKIWGWASPFEKVVVKFNRKTARVTTDASGRWMVTLPAMQAGGPYIMTIDGSNHIILNDILIGDVWLCSGQSNMVHQMNLHAVRYANEIAHANYPQIRHFGVPNTADMRGPQSELSGSSWKKATNPRDLGEFSAVAFFFAESLYQKYHVPIGLINSSWGGTPIEAWMSEESLKNFPDIEATVVRNKDTAYVNRANKRPPDGTSMQSAVNRGMNEKWFDPSYTAKGWRQIAVPGYWEDQGVHNLNGVVWYRREIDVPASMAVSKAKVFLGRIVDADVFYINGMQVGTTSYMYPQRRYSIPDGILKPGKNLFVVRITNNAGKGGFVPDKPYQLIAGKDTIDLTGYWQYKVGQVNIPEHRFKGGGIAAQNQPTTLYNAMLAPLVNYGIKGFLWYQGEANTGRPEGYAKLQAAMIADWRLKWKMPDAPFLFVQLPGFMDMNYLPSESQWAAFREAQSGSLAVPNTAMAVTIDLGEWNDIHPDRKKEVGVRLALAAEKLAYSEKNLIAAGPIFQSAVTKGNEVTLTFTNIGGGLITIDGQTPQEFAVAGPDKKFVWAKTRIEGGKIVLWSDDISNPKYVRYAWADNPVNPNLFNREGFPAMPFRTDKP
jgi:sialate O-acetylesterase